MSWDGVSLILRRAGDSKRNAAARIMVGGVQMIFDEDAAWIAPIDGEPEDSQVRTEDRQRMLGMIDELKAFGDWSVIEELKDKGARWPRQMALESLDAALIVDVYKSYIVMTLPRGVDGDESDFRFWWRIVRTLGKGGRYVAYEAEDDIIATSLSAREARRRYYWF